MIYGIFCIRDVKTGYMTPTVDLNVDSAIRNFAHSLSVSPSVITSFSRDFDLYNLGNFDSDSGLVSPLPAPKFVISATDALSLISREGGVLDADKV